MENIFKDWGVLRIIRLLMGIYIIVESVREHQILLSLLGGFFLYQAIMNTGCTMEACEVKPKHYTRNSNSETVDFEEIK